jgi:hypothetical protein
MAFKSESARRRWYEKYLPFVAQSPERQAEWLKSMLRRLRDSAGVERPGVLSREEIKPYIRLLLERREIGAGGDEDGGEEREGLMSMLALFGDDNLQLMVECAEIYEVPKIIDLLRHCSIELAMTALKKEPPRHEKNPLLVIDRVFQAVREKSDDLLEQAAIRVGAGTDAPADFVANYERFKEIMMDEHILSLLYPKAK